MKRGVIKLLSVLLSIYAAWILGNLALTLSVLGQQAQLLDKAIAETEAEISQQTHELSAMQDDRSFSQLARQLGFISKEDLVFFDGG
jgi:cell division protein FtsB